MLGNTITTPVFSVIACVQILPCTWFSQLKTQSREPGEMTISKTCMNFLKIFFRKIVRRIFRGNKVFHHYSPRPAAIDDRTPDLACLPKACIGSVIFEADNKGDSSTN